MVLLLFQLLPSKMILALLPYVQKISKFISKTNIMLKSQCSGKTISKFISKTNIMLLSQCSGASTREQSGPGGPRY